MNGQNVYCPNRARIDQETETGTNKQVGQHTDCDSPVSLKRQDVRDGEVYMLLSVKTSKKCKQKGASHVYSDTQVRPHSRDG